MNGGHVLQLESQSQDQDRRHMNGRGTWTGSPSQLAVHGNAARSEPGGCVRLAVPAPGA